MLEQLILSGVDVFRLNFSHGTHEEHGQVLQAVRAASCKLGRPVAVMQDLSGPKLRITEMPGNAQEVKEGQIVELVKGTDMSSQARIYTPLVDPAAFVENGHRILISDGTIELVGETKSGGVLRAKVVQGGFVRSRVGIAFPDSLVDLPAVTDKDLRDLEWGIANEVDFVAVSFVACAADVTRVRDIIQAAGGGIHVIPKIERRVALENIQEIIEVSDGILIARGDLGVDLPVEKLPGVQRDLIALANRRGIPAIVATEMLQSMITEMRPTRAEVSDIAWAVASGADALMLSGETAIGKHPAECVNYLCAIAFEAENQFDSEQHRERLRGMAEASVSDAVAFAAAGASEKISAAVVIATTASGETARLIAKYRPRPLILAVSDNDRTLRRVSLYWGVKALKAPSAAVRTPALMQLLGKIQEQENLANGSLAVVTGGLQPSAAGTTSIMQIQSLNYRIEE